MNNEIPSTDAPLSRGSVMVLISGEAFVFKALVENKTVKIKRNLIGSLSITALINFGPKNFGIPLAVRATPFNRSGLPDK